MSGEKHKVLDTLDQYHLLGSGLQSTTNQIYIVFKQRKWISKLWHHKTACKEVQEVEQIKNDSLCLERGILG